MMNKEKIFLAKIKRQKILLSYNVDTLTISKTLVDTDAILKVERFENIYTVVIQIKPQKLYKGFKILKHIYENQNQYFDRSIKLYGHILINKNPIQFNLSNNTIKLLENFKFYNIILPKRLIVIRDKLENIENNIFELYQITEHLKDTIKRIDLQIS